jgi:hypothetical protein
MGDGPSICSLGVGITTAAGSAVSDIEISYAGERHGPGIPRQSSWRVYVFSNQHDKEGMRIPGYC